MLQRQVERLEVENAQIKQLAATQVADFTKQLEKSEQQRQEDRKHATAQSQETEKHWTVLCDDLLTQRTTEQAAAAKQLAAQQSAYEQLQGKFAALQTQHAELSGTLTAQAGLQQELAQLKQAYQESLVEKGKGSATLQQLQLQKSELTQQLENLKETHTVLRQEKIAQQQEIAALTGKPYHEK